jgi:muconolactone delta-isomerase
MRILAIEQAGPAASRGDLKRFLPEEARRVWELQQSDQLREIWFTAADRRAVLLLECASVEEADALLATLPLVRERFITFELHALQAYDGFARLFRAEGR